jgi:IS5 family transposase
MLRDRYTTDKLFEEIVQLVPQMDPILAKIDGYLDDERIFCLIKADLCKRCAKTLQTGRDSTPVEVILRMLVVKRLYRYSYEETEKYVRDSLVLRQFCRVYLHSVPDDTTLIRWAKLIRPQTLQELNGWISQMAVKEKISTGRKLRTDGTVVETNIHPPSDNRLLADSVRVLVRTMQRGHKTLGQATAEGQERLAEIGRRAKRVARQIGETLRKRTEQAKERGGKAYRDLVELTQQTVEEAQQALTLLQQQTDQAAQRLTRTLQTFIPRAEQVIDQTIRRVFQEERVPAQQKIVSLFEAHSDIIVRGKETRPVEYGHKVWLNEIDGGIVSHYRVLEGNPADAQQWIPSLQAHQDLFAEPPVQASGDRGLYSAPNEKAAYALGVQRVILPKGGYRSQQRKELEHQDGFVQGRKWHAGVEGRISVLKRAHGLGRCLNHGATGFEQWVGWGIIAANLAVMGRA